MTRIGLNNQSERVFRYARPEQVPERSDIILSRTAFGMMSVSLFRSTQSSDLHVHTSMDLFWFIVSGSIIMWNERGEVIGEAGPEHGVVVPRGHALRYVATPDPELGVFESYRFTAADVGTAEFADDKVWLSGPFAGPSGLADLASVQASPHAPATSSYRRPVVEFAESEQVLSTTDHGILAVRVLPAGGRTGTYSHDHLDEFWFVRRGGVRFHTGDSASAVAVTDLGPNEGILIPRQCSYWFEATSDSAQAGCELLRMQVSDIRMTNSPNET